MMETYISDSHISFYIPEIKKLELHLPHVCIIVAHHYGNTRREAFNHRRLFQYVLCCRDFSERAVDIFEHQIQSE